MEGTPTVNVQVLVCLLMAHGEKMRQTEGERKTNLMFVVIMRHNQKKKIFNTVRPKYEIILRCVLTR